MQLHGIAFDRGQTVAFLAQAAHESAGFTRLEENLSYTGERLMQVWPQRFPTLAATAPYVHSPHALADLVYADRMGNGDVASGDGWRYRGRGVFMVTGRANYQAVAKLLGDPSITSCPARLCTRAIACAASAAWWQSKPELARLATDEANDDDDADFVSITRTINGGKEGLADRRRWRDAFDAAI